MKNKNKKKVISKQRRKEVKERKKENEKKKKAFCGKWPNGKLMYDSMKEASLKGDVRDYMIVTRGNMLDYRGSYNLEDEADHIVDDIKIIHKKYLKNIVGNEIAKNFWHPILGRLIDVEEGTKSKNDNKNKN